MKKLTLSLALGALIGSCYFPSAQARDTDIYFANPNASGIVKPNVLLILDTSGSMVTNKLPDGKTRLEHMKTALNTILDNIQNANVGLMRFSGVEGGPVLFPVTDIDAPLSSVEGEGTASVTTSLATSNDDAEELISTGVVTLNSPDLDMVHQGGANQIVGLRFQNVLVPRGATITSAYIRFQVEESTTDATSLTIKGQSIGHAPEFSATIKNISSRTPTTASVPWSIVPNWTVGTLTNPAVESTPDIKSIVEEVVGQPGWCSGNAMALTIEGTGRRVAYSYDGDPAGAPVLVINYDPNTVDTSNCITRSIQVRVDADSDDAEERNDNNDVDLDDSILDITYESTRDQYIGIRFDNMDIPRGATILSAHIDLRVNEAGSGSPNYRILAQEHTDPGSFTDNDKNISNRIKGSDGTEATVLWTNIDNPSQQDSVLTTPNLSAIVKEITDKSAWDEDDNAIVFVFKRDSGSGTRLIRSHDDDADRAPLLRVSYQENVTLTTASTVRERLKQIVSSMEAAGSTPIVDTLWEAGLYYRGQPVYYGKKRGDQDGSDARYTRVSHVASYAGTTSISRAAGCTDDNLSSSACETEVITGSPVYESPFVAGCQNSYIVLLTDGAPQGNVSEDEIEGLLDIDDCEGSGDGECAAEIVKYYFENNLSSFTDVHNVVTHVVGFGSDVTSTSAVNFMQGVATAGGGVFKAAGDANELVDAFDEILGTVNESPTSFVSPSLSVNAFNKLYNRDEVYFSLFGPRSKIRWHGNLKKYKLCSDEQNISCTFGEVLDDNDDPAVDEASAKIKTTATSVWSGAADGPAVEVGGAGAEIPARASRRVFTDAGIADKPASAVNLNTAHKVSTTTVTKALLGDTTMSNERQAEIVNWMLGQDIKDDDSPENESDPIGDGNTTEDRWKFSDALHSRPLTITYGGTDADPVIKIFVGTNDGALRMINAANGEEEWIVYISDFLGNQANLMDNPAGSSATHFNGMDGTPSAYVIDKDRDGIIERGSGDRVYLYISQRRGGQNIYAFDVTPDQDSGITAGQAGTTGLIMPKFLWRLRGGSGSFADLGETWARPQIADIRIRCNGSGCNDGDDDTDDSELKTVLIFSGGYDERIDTGATNSVFPADSTDEVGNAIYIVDPLDGSLVWRAGGTGSGANLVLADMKYAIPSDPALLDTNHDGAVDRIYVGDSRGQLFRIDLGDQINPGQTGDGNSSGYLFAKVTDTSHQTKRKFFYPPDVAQVRDTLYSAEPNYDVVAIVTGDREDPLDKLTDAITGDEEPVHNAIYVFRDYNYTSGKAADSNPDADWDPPVTLTVSDLYNTTANQSTLTEAQIGTLAASDGWYIDFKETGAPSWIGEKGLARPVIFDGILFFTTFVPPQYEDSGEACSDTPEGVARAYAVNYLTGEPFFDFVGDSGLERYTAVGGGIPSETVIVIREGGATTLVGTSGGAASPDVDLEMPRYKTYWREE